MAAAVAKSAASDAQKIPPNQSLYIQNLPEKIQKDDLRRELYMLFSTYGPVIDITALKSSKMRGQAHVLFKDIQCATQAMRGCQGFEFLGREMRISYSKNRSNTLAKLTGTFHQPATADQQKQTSQAANSFVAPPGTTSAASPNALPLPPGTLPAPPTSLPAPPAGLPPPSGLPAKPASTIGNTLAPKATSTGPNEAASPQGVKRPREESDDEDAPMDEGEDEGAMEMSDDDD